MTEVEKSFIARAIARAPQWVRNDLAAKAPAVRLRAEETLSAMIINMLEQGNRRRCRRLSAPTSS